VPLIMGGVYERPLPDGRRGWVAELSPPVEMPEPGEGAIDELTRTVAREMEELVARHPEQWHVFQPFWLADRERARR
jgi:KDO2-lipid IV(A) lauroyltransferase